MTEFILGKEHDKEAEHRNNRGKECHVEKIHVLQSDFKN
jgi:hypothetical protein